MKIGVCYNMFNPIFTCYGDDKFKKIKEFGFDTIDFGMTATNTDLYLLPKEEADKLLIKEKELIAQAGMSFSQVHGPWCWPPPETEKGGKEKRMEEMKRSLYNTSVLGVQYTVIHPIMPYFTEEKGTELEQKTWEENIAFFKELAEYAREVGVTICIENMPMPDFSIATPKDIVKLVKEINSENVKICLDTGHVGTYPDMSIKDAILCFGKDLKVLHVHDNLVGPDIHLMPYWGRLDWKEFIEGLKKIEFSGSVSCELIAPGKLPLEMREDYYRLVAKIAKHIVAQ